MIVLVDDVFHRDIVAVVGGYAYEDVVADVVVDGGGSRSPGIDQPVASGSVGVGSDLGHFVVHGDGDEAVGLDVVAGDL